MQIGIPPISYIQCHKRGFQLRNTAKIIWKYWSKTSSIVSIKRYTSLLNIGFNLSLSQWLSQEFLEIFSMLPLGWCIRWMTDWHLLLTPTVIYISSLAKELMQVMKELRVFSAPLRWEISIEGRKVFTLLGCGKGIFLQLLRTLGERFALV